MELHDNVLTLKNIGPALAKKMERLGIQTIQDILFYFPARYLDFSQHTQIKNITPGTIVTINGTIKSIQARFSFHTRKQIVEAVVSDPTGSIKVVWFNQGYIAKQLTNGEQIVLSGKVDSYNGLQLTNPVHEKVTKELLHTGRLVPIYRLPEGLYNRTFREVTNQALRFTHAVEDSIPAHIRTAYNILPIGKAISELHFPSSKENLTAAQKRMIFEEILIQQLAALQHKLQLQKLAAPAIPPDIEYIKQFLQALPFTLTNSQKKAVWQIVQDLEHKHPMNRLLQGDVGSGKTLVALISALGVTAAGFQVVLLAPTEILAKQHYENITQYTKGSLTIGLLTRSFSMIGGVTVTKKQLLENVMQGAVSFIVGTHAVLEDTASFKNLALVIIDEQHRFGVGQRAKLLSTKRSINKQKQYSWKPHLLSMSATPIPRTLALSLYSDLEVSTLEGLPKGRQEIKTKIVPQDERADAYAFITHELEHGRQVFVITPLVEESDKLNIRSVKAEFDRLQKQIFPTFKLGLLHGKLSGVEKDTAMTAFNNHETDILVATSVVEIGIDVPNASVIVIEDADRFGLAQLHQLRGRVGRGVHPSYCLLFTSSTAHTTIERLDFFASCTNGFTLAEQDLKQRGFGSLFGSDQTGFNFTFGQHINSSVLTQAKKAAQELVKESANLTKFPLLQKQTLPLLEHIHLE